MKKYLIEFKNRLLLLIFNTVVVLFTVFYYKETLLLILINSCLNFDGFNEEIVSYFIFTDVTEIFSLYFNLIIFMMQMIVWFFIYHLFTFFNPALFKVESVNVKLLIFSSFASWLISLLVVYYILVPFSWNFFLNFQTSINKNFINLHFEAKLTEYLTFYFRVHYTSVLYFQIFTILIIFLNYFNEKTYIKRYRKIYYYLFILFCTLISPPDLISQIILSVLMIIIYEFLILWFLVKKNY